MRIANLPSIKEDYQLKVTVTAPDGTEINNLRCKVYLPQKPTDRAAIYFLPTRAQGRLVFSGHSSFWKFSLSAKRKELDGTFLRIAADNVFSLGMTSQMWGKNLEEMVWKAEPIDLKVQHVLNRKDASPTECRVWITPSEVLTPAAIIRHSWTGDVEVKPVNIKKYELINGLELEFQTHYMHTEDDDGDTVTTGHLVAVSDLWKDAKGSSRLDKNLFRQIDDILLIAALANRKPCVCYGWRVFDSIGVTDFYRGDISRHTEKKRKSHDDLIDPSNYDEFLRTVYPRFAVDDSVDLIRAAIYAVLPHKGSTIEANFTTLYSGIETVILAFRRQQGLEFIFNKAEDVAEWETLRDKHLKAWLKDQPPLAGSKRAEQRKLVYENLAGLERISFSHAFVKFCELYSLELNDLWPISGGGSSLWSLTFVRHKLVHGDVLGGHKLRALGCAATHLQWILERLILSYLKWDIAKSNVDKGFLSAFMTAHTELKSAQKQISD